MPRFGAHLRNIWNDRPVQDHLQREGNRRRNRWLMRRLHPLGRLLPWLALAMVVVARKPRGAGAP